MELQELEKKYQELGKEIEALKSQKENIKYPIYCLNKYTGLVVKFTNLEEGIVVKNDIYHSVKDKSNCWKKHTNNDRWTQLEVCPATGLFDGQLVWYWFETDTHRRFLGFYDAKNKTIFTFKGKRNGVKWDNYEPFNENYPEWAQKAFKTLER